jgi:hypothetical protein
MYKITFSLMIALFISNLVFAQYYFKDIMNCKQTAEEMNGYKTSKVKSTMPLTHHIILGAPDPVAPFSHAVEADGWANDIALGEGSGGVACLGAVGSDRGGIH